MKHCIALFCVVLLPGFLTAACCPTDNCPSGSETHSGANCGFAKLEGPYLGQTPPGTAPEIFAPGTLSTGLGNGGIRFVADGTEAFFSCGIEKPHYTYLPFHARMVGSHWTEPSEIPIRRAVFHRSAVNPDGTKMIFISSRAEEPAAGQEGRVFIYIADRTAGGGWTEPKKVVFPEEFPHSCSQTSMAANGNLYFQAGYHIDGHEDIFMARHENGEYEMPVRLGAAINGPGHEVHPFIAPDESWLIFDAGRENGFGNHDLYISFRGTDGEWSDAVNMGPQINSPRDERHASISSDGKYLFFVSYPVDRAEHMPEQPVSLTDFRRYVASHENGAANVYWVDAQVIDELRPQ